MASSLEDLPNPALLLRVAYLAASLLILVLQSVPALRTRFLAYGSRATAPNTTKEHHPQQPSAVTQLLDHVATIQVPHNYFTHFYITSVACSLFWAWKLPLWHARPQLQIVWALMLLQGLRRLLESYTYTSTSKSTMWFAHWILGLAFYVTINIAIWIESPGRIPSDWATAALVPAILTAHALQHSYHDYLYRLRTENKGYQLPSHSLFPNLLCPHYTCEVAIYTLLSFLAAPEGRWVNWTLLCGTVFVATNLGVTAVGTKQWYADKFGLDKVGPRMRMVPGMW
ncbi:3-oxo-5-alpha-steroid 4-dehydrogenase-like protein [Cucurbitaria berberidis CBS 394.84]|uniref:Polyprenal reductase n=1 Tax=Cucurbitaria berberidis CBS 394.84 TaxID=1168544 RepID=A0A9P4L5N9_9PLEO|nr:3-oxo-5-alpha-steroid 4-dehydrogenase-like protein [Cucurbitaria berberidis CBS 394.84]KAF1842885.1 3-oxo-5-alpha-steroid 4-dehydrogenase-like protein [Cucurbitaria berberidis CBS 394.84]